MTRVVPATLPDRDLLQARRGAIVHSLDFQSTIESLQYIYSHEGTRCASVPQLGVNAPAGAPYYAPWWFIEPVRPEYTEDRFRLELRVDGTNFTADFRFYYDNNTFQQSSVLRPLGLGSGLSTGVVELDRPEHAYRVWLRIQSNDGANAALINSYEVIPAPLNPADPW